MFLTWLQSTLLKMTRKHTRYMLLLIHEVIIVELTCVLTGYDMLVDLKIRKKYSSVFVYVISR